MGSSEAPVYLPTISSLNGEYQFEPDNSVQVVYSKSWAKDWSGKPMVWLRVMEDGDSKWARLTTENLDDLITELLYARQQIGGENHETTKIT